MSISGLKGTQHTKRGVWWGVKHMRCRMSCHSAAHIGRLLVFTLSTACLAEMVYRCTFSTLLYLHTLSTTSMKEDQKPGNNFESVKVIYLHRIKLTLMNLP